jgi:DNA-binding SARP family transcriptional activator/tetratricopeptide (TPR) repeat protein
VPVEFRLLGPVELLVDGEPRDLGSAKQRCLLAILLLEPDRPIVTETLIDRVWGDDPPSEVRNALYSYLARLRKALHGTGVEITRRSGGYLIDLGEAAVDLWQAAALIEESDVDDRIERLERALDLWRGEPLAGLSGSFVDRARARLHQRRVAVLTEWAGRTLGSGDAHAVVTRLAPAIKAAPTAEPMIATYLRALHKVGRTAEAVEGYHATVRTLDEELGVPPGPALTAVYRDLTGIPAQLPAAPPGFVGRQRQLAELDDLASGIVLVTGMAGVGKTAFAVTWAHRAAARFPDGQLYLDLRGHSPAEPVRPVQALAGFLHALGVASGQIPFDETTAAGLYRSLLATRRMLVVLDNAGSAAQVRPLLPGSGESVVVITSRHRLSSLIVDEGARPLRLDSLPAEDATTLLTRALGPKRVTAESAAVAELITACGRLPLALRIAAANLLDEPRRRVADYVAALAARGSDGIRTAFGLSYQRLDHDQRRLFRLLACHPGPDFTAEAAAALAGIDAGLAGRLLDRLAGAHLVESAAHPRYALHDLLRQYATERMVEETRPEERATAVLRVGDFYLRSTDRAVRLAAPALALPTISTPDGPVADLSEDTALGWLDAELTNLTLLGTNATRRGRPELAWQLAGLLRGYFQLRAFDTRWMRMIDAGLAAARRLDDPMAIAHATISQGYLFRLRGPASAAVESFEEAIRVAERAEWTVGVAAALTQLGLVYPRVGRVDAGIDALVRAIELGRAEDDAAIEGTAHGNLGWVCNDHGLLDRAWSHLSAELVLLRVAPSKYREANALDDIGQVLAQLGDFATAIDNHRAALALSRELGHPTLQAYAQVNLAACYLKIGRLDEAADQARAALGLAVTLRVRGLEAKARSILAGVDDLAGRPAAGQGHRDAVRVARSSGDGRALVEVLTRLAERGTSLSDVDAALEVAREGGYRAFEKRLLTMRARFLQGRPESVSSQ